MEASMLSKRAPSSDIRQLLASAYMKKKKISQIDFVEQLRLEPEIEARADITSNEFPLLEQLRREQLSLNKEIYCLKLRKRSFRTIEKNLVAIDAKLETRKTLPSKPSILGVNKDKIIDDQADSEDGD
ncbi:hypothetical protein F443_12588 [Phytophthora nicotianae P1569]|uniref:Uncharacterized protein n=1 Tax=Phytophthora nicotianae P1569 TaxID=1317065 RepID=V9ETR7_PHYNI|nr:hypothetical protein F443_12588 [Phytophthora nicotianae P1569]